MGPRLRGDDSLPLPGRFAVFATSATKSPIPITVDQCVRITASPVVRSGGVRSRRSDNNNKSGQEKAVRRSAMQQQSSMARSDQSPAPADPGAERHLPPAYLASWAVHGTVCAMHKVGSEIAVEAVPPDAAALLTQLGDTDR